MDLRLLRRARGRAVPSTTSIAARQRACPCEEVHVCAASSPARRNISESFAFGSFAIFVATASSPNATSSLQRSSRVAATKQWPDGAVESTSFRNALSTSLNPALFLCLTIVLFSLAFRCRRLSGIYLNSVLNPAQFEVVESYATASTNRQWN